MINMGYKVAYDTSYSKSFKEWVEEKARKKIDQETTAREKIITRFKPHKENAEALRGKIRKAYLKKHSIE